MGFFGNTQLRDRTAHDRGLAPRVTEEVVHVQAVERDNGVKTATYRSITSALYDLSDTNSKTHTVKLPNGTTIKLAPSARPGLGAYRASFEVIPPKGESKTLNGSDNAADHAKDCDVLALSSADQRKLLSLSESELHSLAEEHIEKLQEKHINVSGYVTKSGRHVGAYSQVRDILAKLKHGETAKFPEGIHATRRGSGFEIKHPKKTGGAFPIQKTEHNVGSEKHLEADAVATRHILDGSAQIEHPKAIGGKGKFKDFEAVDKDGTKHFVNTEADATGPDARQRAYGGEGSGRKEAIRKSGRERADAANDRIRKAGKKRGPDSYAGMEAKNPILNGTDPVSKLKKGEGTVKVGDYSIKTMVQPNAGEGSKYVVTKDGKEVGRHDTPEKAVRQAGEGDEKSKRLLRTDKARSARASQRRDRDESPMPGVIRRPSETDAIRAKEGARRQSIVKPAGTGFQKTSGGDEVAGRDLNTGDTVNFEGHDWKVKQITGGGGKPVNSVNVVPIRSDGSEGSVPRTLEPHSKVSRVGKSKLGDLSGKGAVPGAKRLGGRGSFPAKPDYEGRPGQPVSAGEVSTGDIIKLDGEVFQVQGKPDGKTRIQPFKDGKATGNTRDLTPGKRVRIVSGHKGKEAERSFKEGKGGAAETIDKQKRGGLIGGSPPKARRR